ncbi:hypothetical protein PHIN6_03100 [Polynucleobacter sp. HIN6]|uniref:lysylphosphatidylglycerol synthase transmembrane domain-containing protein n=1 Tax=Polynucleobacter sp. HIN6 TaxID=3047865 RepID=UPI002573B921|nr:lysylphosphatidylglycerol synthase transmembrane domain-containing protein [Polynucleobacter sp. HIN6]BEI34792.1 hypothetical protein PHIN6_03100 [Polynucleobacter sp. HIN6]
MLVALSVIGILFYSNKLDFSSVTNLETRWPWLLLGFCLTIPPFFIVSYRFLIILSSQNIFVPYHVALRWTMIGSFFDLMMPSSNGGDIIKGVYVAKSVEPGSKFSGILAVGFDRVIGILGLFILACLASILGWSYLGDIGFQKEIVGLSFLLGIGPLILFRLLGSNIIYHNKKINYYLPKSRIGFRILQLIGSFNTLRKTPKFFFTSIALSILNHLFWCFSLLVISYSLGQEINPIKGLIVFPIAIFCGIFGFAGGFGIGTFAFEFILSKTLSIDDGALIGLIFQFFGMFSRLLGLPFYLINKSRIKQTKIPLK